MLSSTNVASLSLSFRATHTVLMSTSSSVRKWVLFHIFCLSASQLYCRPLLNPRLSTKGGLHEERCVWGHCYPLPEGQQAGGRGLQQPGDCYGQAHPKYFRKQITGIYLASSSLRFSCGLFATSSLTPLPLQAHVRDKLDETRHADIEQYLKNLYDLYTR